MVSCLILKCKIFTNMRTGHLLFLPCFEAVQVFQDLSWASAVTLFPTRVFVFQASTWKLHVFLRIFFFQVKQQFPRWQELESHLFSRQLCYFNVLVIKQKTGPYSSGYGGFRTILWTLSEVWWWGANFWLYWHFLSGSLRLGPLKLLPRAPSSNHNLLPWQYLHSKFQPLWQEPPLEQWSYW